MNENLKNAYLALHVCDEKYFRMDFFDSSPSKNLYLRNTTGEYRLNRLEMLSIWYDIYRDIEIQQTLYLTNYQNHQDELILNWKVLLDHKINIFLNLIVLWPCKKNTIIVQTFFYKYVCSDFNISWYINGTPFPLNSMNATGFLTQYTYWCPKETFARRLYLCPSWG